MHALGSNEQRLFSLSSFLFSNSYTFVSPISIACCFNSAKFCSVHLFKYGWKYHQINLVLWCMTSVFVSNSFCMFCVISYFYWECNIFSLLIYFVYVLEKIAYAYKKKNRNLIHNLQLYQMCPLYVIWLFLGHRFTQLKKKMR